MSKLVVKTTAVDRAPRLCAVCNKDISNRPSQRKTCGTVCGSILSGRTLAKPLQTRICACCGRDFALRFQNDTIKTCSRSCSGRMRTLPSRKAVRQGDDEIYAVPLTKGLIAFVDAQDIDLADYRWNARADAKGNYARRLIYVEGVVSRRVLMHREVLERMIGRPLEPGEVVDHINGNGLDNRRCNLRVATLSQNGANRRLHKSSRSGYKGVSFDKKSGKWVAKIYPNRQQITLGRFNDPAEAHKAYVEAARIYFGDFANDGVRAAD